MYYIIYIYIYIYYTYTYKERAEGMPVTSEKVLAVAIVVERIKPAAPPTRARLL